MWDIRCTEFLVETHYNPIFRFVFAIDASSSRDAAGSTRRPSCLVARPSAPLIHALLSMPPVLRSLVGMATTGPRVRAKSWTGAAMRLPHPRLVHTWAFAL